MCKYTGVYISRIVDILFQLYDETYSFFNRNFEIWIIESTFTFKFSKMIKQ